jgi:GT2 family glycosyltransferase
MEQAVQSTALVQERVNRQPSPRASIIIVSYNAREKLFRCLASVMQYLASDCEIIVVDNASHEGNADAIENDFPEITLIRSATNLGFAGGCNLGVEQARGTYLIFLNPDTLVDENWLQALLRPLETDEKAGLVTAKILLMEDRERINTCGCNIHITGLTLCRGMGWSRRNYTEVDEVGAISGAAFAIRRQLFNRLGGFDEEMFLYMEDTDLSLRARLLGFPTLYVPDSIVYHDYELRITPLKVFWQERNRYLMLLKSFKWPTLLLLLPVHLLAELITWSFVLISDRGNFRNKLNAYAWILRNWSLVMDKRRTMQELRTVPDRELLRQQGFRLDFGQAAGGLVAGVADLLFNPLFFILRSFLLALVWW